MKNAQALDHTNGLSKYVCKYIGNFDEGNHVFLFQDTHTGQWILGKSHLCNTKIVHSNINEKNHTAKIEERILQEDVICLIFRYIR